MVTVRRKTVAPLGTVLLARYGRGFRGQAIVDAVALDEAGDGVGAAPAAFGAGEDYAPAGKADRRGGSEDPVTECRLS
jgi:hypothetical protein